MPDYSQMTVEELKKEMANNEEMIQDALQERKIMGAQKGQHIITSVFEAVDRDIARYEARIKQIKEFIDSKSG